MRRTVRTLRVLKWVGTVACVTVILAWVYTRLGGNLALGNVAPFNEAQVKLSDTKLWVNLGMAWLDTEPPQPKYLGFVGIPLLGILVCLLVPTAILWMIDRKRPRLGCCRNCGYDLTGNRSGACPECGVSITAGTE